MTHERRGLSFFEAVTDELYEENKRLHSENEALASYFAHVNAHLDEYQELGVGMCADIAKLTREKDVVEAQMQRLAEQNHALQLSNQALQRQVADLQLLQAKGCSHSNNQLSDTVLVAVPIPMAQLKQEHSLAAQVHQLQQHSKSQQEQIDRLSAAREQVGHDSVKAFASTLSMQLDAIANRRAGTNEPSNQEEVNQTPDPLVIFARQLSKQLNDLASRPKLRRRSE